MSRSISGIALALVAFVVALLGGALPALAQESRIVTTHHQVTVGGRKVAYTARAGFLPIIDNEAGDVHANVFFVAYTVERAPGQRPRPLTFAWNGGPGSNAGFVHFLGFGPRRIRRVGDAAQPERQTSVVEDNPGSWIDMTDLVFVDPVGTGYSRPTKPEYAAEFYQTRGDNESIAEFIRTYRNRFDAWDSPLFLAGESYGVVRAAGVAEAMTRRGIRLKGVALISLAMPLGPLPTAMGTALGVPTMTAAAFHHKKLVPELLGDLPTTLRLAEAFAEQEYAPALEHRDSLSAPQRTALLAKLSRFTGLDARYFDVPALSIGLRQVDELLLRREGRYVGRYDTRLTSVLDTTPRPYDPHDDPSLNNLLDDVAVLSYYRSELGFTSDLFYQGPWGGGYPAPASFRGDWMSMRWERGPLAASERPRVDSATARAGAGSRGAPPQAAAVEPMRAALLADRGLRVLSVCGYYDLVCAYAANDWVAARLDPAIRDRVVTRAYPGGHAIYTDAGARDALKRDMGRLIAGTLSRESPK